MSKKPAFSLLFFSFASAYLIYLDRKSPIALHAVELEQRIGLPLPGILFVIGAGWLAWAWKKSSSSATARTQRTSRTAHYVRDSGTNKVTITAESGTQEWRLQIQDSAKNIKLPVGARMEIDLDSKYPIVLILEQAPSERCRRAISEVAVWISTIPTPPRLKVTFNQCPEGGSPRHHQVNGAFAQSHDRAHYKVVRHLDEVDVLFSHPNPQWTQ